MATEATRVGGWVLVGVFGVMCMAAFAGRKGRLVVWLVCRNAWRRMRRPAIAKKMDDPDEEGLPPSF